MANDNFEIMSGGVIPQVLPHSTVTVRDIDPLFDANNEPSGYTLEWEETILGGLIGRLEADFDLFANPTGDPRLSDETTNSTFAEENGFSFSVFSDRELFATTVELPYETQADDGFFVFRATDNPERLNGSSRNERVFLEGGNDEYTSYDGDRSLNPGGVDEVFGGDGNDVANLSNLVGSEEFFAGHFDGGPGTRDNLNINGSVDDYRIIEHGDRLVFRHQDFEDLSNLGRKIATAENIEFFRNVDLMTLLIEDGFAIRATTPTGPAPSNISAIRDFDGNDLGAGNDWRLLGAVDAEYDNDAELVYVNPTLGRWATVGPGDNGGINFANHGQGGDTRVVGIYIDPLVELGIVERFSPIDSQQRFQEDLRTDTLELVTGFDFDADGFQEIYFRETNGDAYLRALMHADGNIQYANYQNAQQVEDYLSGLGYGDEVIETILG